MKLSVTQKSCSSEPMLKNPANTSTDSMFAQTTHIIASEWWGYIITFLPYREYGQLEATSSSLREVIQKNKEYVALKKSIYEGSVIISHIAIDCLKRVTSDDLYKLSSSSQADLEHTLAIPLPVMVVYNDVLTNQKKIKLAFQNNTDNQVTITNNLFQLEIALVYTPNNIQKIINTISRLSTTTSKYLKANYDNSEKSLIDGINFIPRYFAASLLKKICNLTYNMVSKFSSKTASIVHLPITLHKENSFPTHTFQNKEIKNFVNYCLATVQTTFIKRHPEVDYNQTKQSIKRFPSESERIEITKILYSLNRDRLRRQDELKLQIRLSNCYDSLQNLCTKSYFQDRYICTEQTDMLKKLTDQFARITLSLDSEDITIDEIVDTDQQLETFQERLRILSNKTTA